MRGELNTKSPEKTKYKYKKLFPNFYWSRTFYEMQNDARKTYEKIKIKTRFAIENRKNFKGILSGTKGESIMIEVDNESLLIDFENIDKARLDPDY